MGVSKNDSSNSLDTSDVELQVGAGPLFAKWEVASDATPLPSPVSG